MKNTDTHGKMKTNTYPHFITISNRFRACV